MNGCPHKAETAALFCIAIKHNEIGHPTACATGCAVYAYALFVPFVAKIALGPDDAGALEAFGVLTPAQSGTIWGRKEIDMGGMI